MQKAIMNSSFVKSFLKNDTNLQSYKTSLINSSVAIFPLRTSIILSAEVRFSRWTSGAVSSPISHRWCCGKLTPTYTYGSYISKILLKFHIKH